MTVQNFNTVGDVLDGFARLQGQLDEALRFMPNIHDDDPRTPEALGYLKKRRQELKEEIEAVMSDLSGEALATHVQYTHDRSFRLDPEALRDVESLDDLWGRLSRIDTEVLQAVEIARREAAKPETAEALDQVHQLVDRTTKDLSSFLGTARDA